MHGVWVVAMLKWPISALIAQLYLAHQAPSPRAFIEGINGSTSQGSTGLAVSVLAMTHACGFLMSATLSCPAHSLVWVPVALSH
jgi:hypothetical protein